MVNFNKADFLTSYGTFEQLPPSTTHEIAFAGRSNVGKSSIINKILNRKGLARISSSPGKTATINFYTVDNIHFVDLPGYGYAKVAKSDKKRWSDLIEGYFNSERNFSLIILLIDMRHIPSELDINMVNYLIELEFPFVVCFTKSDKLNATQTKERMNGFINEIPNASNIKFIYSSAQTGKGIDEIHSVINIVCENDIETIQSEEPQNGLD